ncbi:MAG: DUF1080 domain-containing protein [Pirellulaceae bacterium]
MSRTRLIAGFIVLTAAAVAAQAQDEDGFVSMFNGKDLSGWKGRPGAWRVEEGAITGESTTENPSDSTHYLYWTNREPADFIMRFQIKLVGGNSGVQFRSEKRPHFDTFGYQADFDATNQWTGCLFQHRRGAVVQRGSRATISAQGERHEQSFASMESLAETVKRDDFNDYEIVAKGSKVTLRINGRLMCEVDDRDATQACRKGIIALQMHKGPPMKVQFKNLRIQVLDGARSNKSAEP